MTQGYGWTAHAEEFEAPEGFPLVAFHGFGGDHTVWEAIAPHFDHLLAPDLPGHGGASPLAGEWSLGSVAKTMLPGLPPQFDLVGYSLGGRLALALALEHPERVRRLALVSASAGVEDETARYERRTLDDERAEVLRKEGVGAFFREWDQLPMFATRKQLPAPVLAAIAERRAVQGAAGLAWAISAFSPGREPAVTAKLARLAPPTLWLAGELDPGYGEAAVANAALSPNARAEIFKGVGHDLLAEAPEALAKTLTAFFSPSP